ILESIPYSYRFLQTLVDSASSHPEFRFAPVFRYIERAWSKGIGRRPDPCRPQQSAPWPDADTLQQWLYCYFESIGRLIVLESGESLQMASANHLELEAHEDSLPLVPTDDTCDLQKVRLTHLDGTPVTVDEYDRIQRFIRLWRKLGWTID